LLVCLQQLSRPVSTHSDNLSCQGVAVAAGAVSLLTATVGFGRSSVGLFCLISGPGRAVHRGGSARSPANVHVGWLSPTEFRSVATAHTGEERVGLDIGRDVAGCVGTPLWCAHHTGLHEGQVTEQGGDLLAGAQPHGTG